MRSRMRKAGSSGVPRSTVVVTPAIRSCLAEISMTRFSIVSPPCCAIQGNQRVVGAVAEDEQVAMRVDETGQHRPAAGVDNVGVRRES